MTPGKNPGKRRAADEIRGGAFAALGAALVGAAGLAVLYLYESGHKKKTTTSSAATAGGCGCAPCGQRVTAKVYG